LETVRQFVNTYDIEDDKDEIASPEALSAWLGAHDLPVAAPTDADVATFRDAREALRALMLANNGAPRDPAAVARLNELADSVHMRLRFGDDSTLEPAGDGLQAALGTLIATVHASMEEGTWPRLKACRDDNCQWAFYDHSRNRSGTWCSMEVCGNRAKARTFRARKASSPGKQ
jgi:predicted RNA-binding Zn ribbon-like protein